MTADQHDYRERVTSGVRTAEGSQLIAERIAANEPDTIYAVCVDCAHVEPRPQHAAQDWARCENCGSPAPLLHEDPDFAEEASEAILSWGSSS